MTFQLSITENQMEILSLALDHYSKYRHEGDLPEDLSDLIISIDDFRRQEKARKEILGAEQSLEEGLKKLRDYCTYVFSVFTVTDDLLNEILSNAHAVKIKRENLKRLDPSNSLLN